MSRLGSANPAMTIRLLLLLMVMIAGALGQVACQPNYRGSNNQRMEFQRAVVNDAGDGPARDVMSGVELLKERGMVDEARIAASGWSYGGFMTAWLMAHYDGWAAAVAGAPVTDWFDSYTGGRPGGERKVSEDDRMISHAGLSCLCV